MKEILVILILVAIFALALLPAPRGQAIGPSSGLIVVDGDTIRDATGVPHRLIGFDTPETGRNARSECEHRMGKKAQARVQQLIASGPARLVPTGKADKYKRSLSHLYVTVDGREQDIRDILIKEKLARPYSGRTKRDTWC